MGRSSTAVLLASLAGLAACRGAGTDEELPPPTVERPPFTIPADWQELPTAEFEELALSALPEGVVTSIEPAGLHQLAEALDRMDESSLRAAVLLGRSHTPASGEVLWNRLEKRELGPDRGSDAGDVVAAAALARFPEARQYWRLVRLVDGPLPHPDFEVRVECACTALVLGIDRVIPFLLRVLRVGTWEGQGDAWERTPPMTTAWARGRAAEALSVRAGVPVTYRTDAPLADREREARHLAELLLPLLEPEEE
jgi:hypothetical protein